MILFISSKTSECRYGKQFYFNLGDDRTETSSLLTDPEWQNEDVNIEFPDTEPSQIYQNRMMPLMFKRNVLY